MRDALHPHQAEALAMLRRSLGQGTVPVVLNGIEFRVISGRPRYLVSETGEVVSLIRSGRFLRQTRTPQGYYYVSLMNDDGKAEKCLVHRLVATAFVQKKQARPVVNHKDGVKTNNRAENLEWCSFGYNNEHARNNGLANSFGSGHYAARLTESIVQEIRALANSGLLHRQIAERFGVRRQQVTKIVNRQAWARVA